MSGKTSPSQISLNHGSHTNACSRSRVSKNEIKWAKSFCNLSALLLPGKPSSIDIITVLLSFLDKPAVHVILITPWKSQPSQETAAIPPSSSVSEYDHYSGATSTCCWSAGVPLVHFGRVSHRSWVFWGRRGPQWAETQAMAARGLQGQWTKTKPQIIVMAKPHSLKLHWECDITISLRGEFSQFCSK